MSSEAPQVQENKEAIKEVNSYPLSIDKDAGELLAKWQMEFKDDTIYLDGKKMDDGTGGDVKFYDVVQISLSAIGDTLIYTEMTKNGPPIIVKEKDPTRIGAHIMYAGCKWYLNNSPGYKDNAELLRVVTQLEGKYPDFKTE